MFTIIFAVGFTAGVGCGPSAPGGEDPGDNNTNNNNNENINGNHNGNHNGNGCIEGEIVCVENERLICSDGEYIGFPCDEGEYCNSANGDCEPCVCNPAETPVCVDTENLQVCREDCSGYDVTPCGFNRHCEVDECVDLVCTPGSRECVDEHRYRECDEDGMEWGDAVDCVSPATRCQHGHCVSPCDMVEGTMSNLGCHFWAVDMPNLIPDLVFAVSISNTSHDQTTNIQIFDKNGGTEQLVASGSVAPRDVSVFMLAGTSNGQQGFYPGDAGLSGNGIALGRAFRIESDYPVVAVQFNPIGGASGHSTDASLLLPRHTIGNDYIHMAFDQGHGGGSTMIIVAENDNTVVTVTPTVNTTAGQNGLPAMTAGVPTDILIDRYDYIQLTTGPNNQDLSGSIIEADAPVAVFGGHTCANVPDTNTVACDHVEQQIFPVNTWGKRYVAMRNPPRGGEAMQWHILGSQDNTTVNFDPPVSLGSSITIDRGEVVRFQDMGDFFVEAVGGPILVTGFMLGWAATDDPERLGDPYMVHMIPVEQYLTDYVFLVDDSYDEDFVKLVRSADAEVSIGCFGTVEDHRWTDVGQSGYQTAVINMNPGENGCTTGVNEATGIQPFGIVVSGQAFAASYAYPGGLALRNLVTR